MAPTRTHRPLDSHAISSAMPMRQALRHFGVQVHRGDRRADCPLCEGNSRGTIAFSDRLWKCHRCGAGGDVFTLVRLMNRCDFPTALVYVADLAGIKLEHRSKTEIQAQQHQRERVQAAAAGMADAIHDWRVIARSLLHQTERKQRRCQLRLPDLRRGEPERFSGEEDALWATMAACADLVRRYAAAYNLLSFGGMFERAKFVTSDAAEREAIVTEIVNSGFIHRDHGALQEVAL